MIRRPPRSTLFPYTTLFRSPNVHLVGLALQVFEEALDAVPGLGPLAIPVGRAVQHPAFLRVGELGPGRVARNAFGLGVAHQVVLDRKSTRLNSSHLVISYAV